MESLELSRRFPATWRGEDPKEPEMHRAFGMFLQCLDVGYPMSYLVKDHLSLYLQAMFIVALLFDDLWDHTDQSSFQKSGKVS